MTEANLLLGYLNSDYFLGGAMRLDVSAARRAFATQLCPHMGGSAEDCARSVFEVVNHTMLAAGRVHIAERGQDPRKLHLFAFGGAGPAHAYELTRALQMQGVIVPAAAGAASALGLVASPVAFAFDAGIGEGQAAFSYRMDTRHLGQGREITVEIPAALIAAGDLGGICECFYREHQTRFGHVHRHLPVELISCRTTAQGPEIAFPLRHVPPAGPVAPKAWRPVFFPEAGCFLDTPVYERSALGSDFAAQGPAMIEERECTVAVGPAARVRVDGYGSLLLDMLGTEARRG